MAYQALYRKWRPLSFDDVRGQDHIVTTLKNQIKMDRIGHAYLFCGTRGTGKTSVAKIFARAVNCEHPVDGSPCNECEMCRAANEQRSMNVIEIDAASNNGVDNIREIRDEVAFSPAQGRYKVYIIDEVHMLSPGAYNALLKTLEEPPSYVIFILATTEPHRIPVTILSRCQRYDFHRITVPVISGRLRELCDAEGIDAEDEALAYIARIADGSMRDALSLLDQCVSFYIGQKLTYVNVLDVLGAVDTAVFGRMFRSIAQGDAGAALRMLGESISQGRDVMQFTQDMIMYFRNLMMVQCGDAELAAAYVSGEQLAALKDEAGLTDTETLMRFIRILSELSADIRYSSQKRILLEIAIVKMCRPAMETDVSSLVQRMDMLESRLAAVTLAAAEGAQAAAGGRGAVSGAAGSAQTAQTAEKTASKNIPRAAAAAAGDVGRVIREWDNVFRHADTLLQIMIRKTVPMPGDGDQILLYCEDKMTFGYFAVQKNMDMVRDAVGDYVNAEVDVRARMGNAGQTAGEDDFDPVSLLNTDGIKVVDE